ncbi:glycoside hydrolase family 5 protein [Flammeovirgaceae bacterium SG7u.111]|nr:glycoside hydrolase family 5 protein [Flammeovirgaceae bacterium SG7u.132]WPO33702.1 glycoside hydrolase family 5 protein [Flammeovirgaceae bacterium SG7u.111]
MNLLKLLLLFTLLLNGGVLAQTPFGVNLAGAEFESEIPGKFNVNYTYPTASELDYYKSKGLMLVRLPFRWERIQPTLNSSLDPVELKRIKDFVQSAKERNIVVLLDLHNYCRYELNGKSEIIGSKNLSIAHFKDVWSKLSAEFKNTPTIWGYGIMNEPHDLLSSTSWFSMAQEAISGIRKNDTKTRIVVAGDSWSSAERWVKASDNLKNLSDPSNNLVFEAHVYFDDNASGMYAKNYDEEYAYPNIGVDRVKPFVNWLKTNKLKGFIGEYGVPSKDKRWLVPLDNFLRYLKANCINGTYWAGGPWWGEYHLSVEPEKGVDKPQMGILEKYTSLSSSCPK